MPDGLLEIKHSAFSNIKFVENVTIPTSVEIIDDYVFFGCSLLEKVIFPVHSNLTSIGGWAFDSTHIGAFAIPENVMKVSGCLFYDIFLSVLGITDSNKYLELSHGIIYSKNGSILYLNYYKDKNPFYYLNNVTTLSDYLFYGSNLRAMAIPNSVTTIGDNCFHKSEIRTITISNSISSIPDSCFESSDLVTITIPENVKRIGNKAFYECKNLINATILGSLDYIGVDVFEDCDNLELIIFPNSTMNVTLTDAIVTNQSPKLRFSFKCKILFSSFAIGRITNISISYRNESNLIINRDALIMNFDQTEIYEFWGYDITSISIPKSVQTIKESAFENSIIRFVSTEQDSELLTIESYAFRKSNIESINIFSTHFECLGYSVFQYCKSLTSISFESTDFVIMKNAFDNCINLQIVTNISNVPSNCFSRFIKLDKVTIGEGSTSVGVKSFDNCTSLHSVSIPSSIQIISENAFLNCIKLKFIIIEYSNSISSISLSAFSGCRSLANISDFSSDNYECIDNVLYSKNETGKYLIFHLRNSTNTVLIINCDVICSYSFNYSNNIENISISSNSVSLIEENSFNKCLRLKYINFPLSVQYVQNNAFNDCKSIQCPLIISNTTVEYLQMIEYSGISRFLMIQCHVVHGTHKLQFMKRICCKYAKVLCYLTK